MIYQDIWASIVVACNELITDFRSVYPGEQIEFIDWEAHGSIPELPNSDLVGPASLTISEVDVDMIEATISIAVSSYGNDESLFRHRFYAASVFERMRIQESIEIFNSATGASRGLMYFTDGTIVAPMSRAEARPWQYVQGRALLEPLLAR